MKNLERMLLNYYKDWFSMQISDINVEDQKRLCKFEIPAM